MKYIFCAAILTIFLCTAKAQTNFEGINLIKGRDLIFKGSTDRPTDAGDIVFQKSDGVELARMRSHHDDATGLGAIVLSNTPFIKDNFWFMGEGNFGIGTTIPKSRLEVQAPLSNVSTAILHSNGHQSWGHVLALVTDDPTGDDPKLLFSYRNKAKQWSLGGGNNETSFHLREDGGDGVYGTAPGTARFTVLAGGNVGIGTDLPQEKLSVKGNIRAQQVKVEMSNWPDYVFEETYQLPSLKETEAFIKANKHLPGVPKAKEIEEDGLSLGEMNRILMQKVEELTLHLINKDKEISQLKETNTDQYTEFSKRLSDIEKALKK
ncbi:hypothetical protein OKW96_18030 [Sphingobacterium sp. KU25419]|nr:hypothetical protein OKW96_18030 [Sphingobacterium sp. KU25419]